MAAKNYVNLEKGVETVEDALAGASDIISEQISDSAELRKSLKGLLDRIGQLHSEAATEEEISQFEENHKVKLPEKYKEWLQHSDGGDCFLPAGVQFYGVSHKPRINVECNDRPDDSYIVIGALDTGDPMLLKLSKDSAKGIQY